MLTVSPGQVLRFGARATGPGRRRHLTHGALGDAAHGGLQDSVVRGALTALHARLEGVRPGSWEDPSLWQIWFRGADYVVPRDDFGVFTIGALPEHARRIDDAAVAVCQMLAGRPLDARELGDRLPASLRGMGVVPPPRPVLLLRGVNAAGRYRIRWDASRVTVIPTARPLIDAGQARLDLARRFLGWHGPATAAQFARWAGVSREDAALTWKELAPELMPVEVAGGVRHLQLRDEKALREAEPVSGVRLLLQGDPYFAIDRPPAGAPVPPVSDDRGTP